MPRPKDTAFTGFSFPSITVLSPVGGLFFFLVAIGFRFEK